MKITVIHGQSHKGSTYNIARELYEKLGGEVIHNRNFLYSNVHFKIRHKYFRRGRK